MKIKQTSEALPLSRSSQDGFTLLEVLIAVMIMGLSITTIMQQFSVALRAGSKTQEVTKAVLHAKEKLEELKTKKDLSESTESGDFDDGHEWETQIIPYTYAEEDDAESYESLHYETFQLKAIVTRHFGERASQIELTTLKTVRKREWK